MRLTIDFEGSIDYNGLVALRDNISKIRGNSYVTAAK